MECGILSDQGSNLHLPHWQANSLPLSHQGSPKCLLTQATKLAFQAHILLPFLKQGRFHIYLGPGRSRSPGTSCLYSSSKPEGWFIPKTSLDLLFFFWGSIRWNVAELGLSLWKFRCSTSILAPKPCVSGVPVLHSSQFKLSAKSTAAWMDLEIVILKGVSQTYKDKYCMISHMWNLKKLWWLFFSL